MDNLYRARARIAELEAERPALFAQLRKTEDEYRIAVREREIAEAALAKAQKMPSKDDVTFVIYKTTATMTPLEAQLAATAVLALIERT